MLVDGPLSVEQVVDKKNGRVAVVLMGRMLESGDAGGRVMLRNELKVVALHEALGRGREGMVLVLLGGMTAGEPRLRDGGGGAAAARQDGPLRKLNGGMVF